jgi:SAM-dependent methyltransferase
MEERWTQIARVYDKLLPPNRPSTGDIKVYAELMHQYTKEKMEILLLGSTPELRDLLQTLSIIYDANITCVDLSEDMYQAMSILKEAESSKEIFINKPWQDTGLPKAHYDIVVGDEVIVNVPVEERDQFFKEIIRLLKPTGLFITRHNAVELKDKELNKKLIKEEFRKVLNLEETIGQGLNNISEIYLYHLAFHRCGQKVTTGDVLDACHQLIDEMESDNRMYSILKEMEKRAKLYFEPTRDQTWVYNTRANNEKELEKFFRILKKAKADDYITVDNKYFYVLEPKNE